MLQLSQEWFDARKDRITGSRVAAILNLSPFQKQSDVLRAMVREHHGADSEFTGNVATQWGNTHEDAAIDLYEFMTDTKVERIGFVEHPDYDWIGVSPDGLISNDGLIEVKCPYSQKLPKSPDAHYEAQVQFQLWVTGRKWCDLFYWTPAETRTFRIKYDPDFATFNFIHLSNFHDLYLAELDNPEHLEPKILEREDDEYHQAVIDYMNAKDALNSAQAEEKAARQVLIDLSGGKACKGFGVAVTPYKRAGSVNYKSIPALDGVNLDEYRGEGTTTYRVTIK